jgi:hypothetical protein
MERQRRAIPDAAETARVRDPLYIRDPDGYIIEVGQTIDRQGDWWPADWPPIHPSKQSD